MKDREREILIKRFFYDDRSLYKLGKAAGIKWFDNFDYKFTKDDYAFFATEERIEAIEKFNIKKLNDEKFINALNGIGTSKYISIDRFVGKYYCFDIKKESIFKLEDRREEIAKDVQRAIEDIGNRAYYFLKAIIHLYRENKWDKAYGGASWIDILAKVRDLGGMYPAPRDIPILKSYRIYYKTGSKRYPTHTIPEEMIDTIEKELNKNF